VSPIPLRLQEAFRTLREEEKQLKAKALAEPDSEEARQAHEAKQTELIDFIRAYKESL
jgi:hypothetical protein